MNRLNGLLTHFVFFFLNVALSLWIIKFVFNAVTTLLCSGLLYTSSGDKWDQKKRTWKRYQFFFSLFVAVSVVVVVRNNLRRFLVFSWSNRNENNKRNGTRKMPRKVKVFLSFSKKRKISLQSFKYSTRAEKKNLCIEYYC